MSQDPNNKYSWDLEDDVQASLAKEAIEILDKNRAQLHTVLRRFDAYKPAERRDARRRCVDEFLMLIAENSGVTSDLVHPGSHKHRVRERDNLARHVQATTGTFLKSPNPYLAPTSTQAPIRLAPSQHGQQLHSMPANGMNGMNGHNGPGLYHQQPYPAFSGFTQPPPQDAQQQQPPFQYVFSAAAPAPSPNSRLGVPSAGPVARSLPPTSPAPAPSPSPAPAPSPAQAPLPVASPKVPVPSPKPPAPPPEIEASPPPEVPPPPRAISPLALGSAVGVGSPPAATPRSIAAVASPALSKTSRRVSPAASKAGSPPQVPPKSPPPVSSPAVTAPEIASASTSMQVPPAVQRVVPVFFALPENSLLLDIHSQAGHISEIIMPQSVPTPPALGAPAPLSPVPPSPAPSGISVGTSRRKEIRSPPTGQPGTPRAARSPPLLASSSPRPPSRPPSAASVAHAQTQRMQAPGPITMPSPHPMTPVLKVINPTPEGNIVSVIAQGTGSSDYRLSMGSASASPVTALEAVPEEGHGRVTEGAGEERGGFSTWLHAEDIALARALEGNVREREDTRVRGGLADEYYDDGQEAGTGAPNVNNGNGASSGDNDQPTASADGKNA